MEKILKQPAGYKRIFGGLVPLGWSLKDLSSYAEIEYGIGDPLNDSLKIGIKILSLPNINKDGDLILEKVPFIAEDKVKDSNYLHEGDLLFNWRNGSKEHLGKTAYFDLQGKYTHVGFLLRIRTDRSKLDPFYLKTYINFLRNNGFFLSAKIQVNNTFNKEELCELPIIAPQIKEQNAIASVISTWDKAIEKTQEIIGQKELLKKTLMQQLLMGKKKINGSRSRWIKYRFDQLLEEVERPVEWNDNEIYDLISVRRRSGGLFHRDSIYGHSIKTKVLRIVKSGDFLFSKMQIVHGASGLVTAEFDGMKISGSYIAVISKNSKILDIEYFDLYSRTHWFYHQTLVSSYGVHIEKMTFDFETFLTMTMKIPPLDEQREIVKIIKSLEREIDLLLKKLALIKEQKKGLMQKLLTGQKKVEVG